MYGREGEKSEEMFTMQQTELCRAEWRYFGKLYSGLLQFHPRALPNLPVVVECAAAAAAAAAALTC
jgi:hypothetical protein